MRFLNLDSLRKSICASENGMNNSYAVTDLIYNIVESFLIFIIKLIIIYAIVIT